MAFDCFLKIGTVPGESSDSKHKDWIEILSFSHGVSQPSSGSPSSGGGRSAERVDHQSFKVTKAMDKASPKLHLACCNGEHIGEVTLELCRATGNKQKYMDIKLADVIVGSVRPSGSASGASPLPLEDVGFNYGKITWTYTETDHKTGEPKGDVSAFWNLVENEGG